MSISDYIVTYQYAVFTTRANKTIKKILKKLITSRSIVFAIDSAAYMYLGVDGKLSSLPLDVEFEYGQMNGSFKLNEEIYDKLPEFHKINLINSIGLNIFENNLTPTNGENEYISLYYSLIILYVEGFKIYSYPIAKIYSSGIIIVELSIYSPYDISCLSEKDFIDFYTNFRIQNFDKIQIVNELLDFKDVVYNDTERIVSDGISREYSVDENSKLKTIKDIAIFLVENFLEDEYSFIAHHNYSINCEKFSNRGLQSLMNGIKYDVAEDLKKLDYKNYREFKNSHKHYMTIGNTVTIGDIEDTRIPSLVIDQLFLYMATLTNQLRKKVNSDINSIQEILKLYNKVLNIKGYLINGLNAYSFSREIFIDLFNDYRLAEQIENLKELIEVELKKLELLNSKRDNNSQNFIAFILALISSETLLVYLMRPVYLELMSKAIEDITIVENILLLLLPSALLLVFLVLRKLYLRKS